MKEKESGRNRSKKFGKSYQDTEQVQQLIPLVAFHLQMEYFS